MRTNADLQKDVQDAIKWEPLLRAAEIGVTVSEGIVTLSGTVDSYWKKSEAEEATRNVAGVRAVVEKIEIRPVGSLAKKEDSEIATEVLKAFKWTSEIPAGKIKIKVEKGRITLDGDVEWNYQREAAKKVIKDLPGVTGITSNLKINLEMHDAIERSTIEAAISRNWTLSDLNIQVKVSGTKVVLSGSVKSWYQKNEAGRIAWNAPGVLSVDNQLVILNLSTDDIRRSA